MTCAPLPSAPRHCCSRHALYVLVGSSAVCSPTPHKANPTAVPRGLEQCWNRDGTRRFCPVNKGVTECVTVLVWGGPILPVGAHSSAGHTVLAGPCHCRAPADSAYGGRAPPGGTPGAHWNPSSLPGPLLSQGMGSPALSRRPGFCPTVATARTAPGQTRPLRVDRHHASGAAAGRRQARASSVLSPESQSSRTGCLTHTPARKVHRRPPRPPVPIFAPAQGLQGRGKAWEGRATGRWPHCVPESGSGRPR